MVSVAERRFLQLHAGNQPGQRPGDGFNSVDIDVGIAVEHAVLAAAAEGLGSCWICAFDAAKAAQVLDVKAPARVAALCPLGYPAAPPRPFVRKDEAQVIEVLD